MTTWLQGKVVENQHWNDRLCSLKIDVELPEFEAGQFIRVGLPNLKNDEQMDARPYSFVNAPHEELLEIYFNQVPEGNLSNLLGALRSGDAVYVANRPAGFMTMQEIPAGETLWLLASGTALGLFCRCLKRNHPGSILKRLCWYMAYGVPTNWPIQS